MIIMAQIIGIIGAMDDEISMYLEHIKDLKETKWNIFTFYEGTIENQNVVLVKSGVGKVFASMVSQHMIDTYSPDKILFTGVSGSINPILDIGDVIIGTDSVHHDFDASPLGFKRGQISYTDYQFFKCDEDLIKLAETAKLDEHKIIKGRILTGDQFFTQKDKETHTYIRDELHGDCIEMEGAAVGQVCVVNNIPHLIIRTTSDKANESAVLDYNSFKSIVAMNSFKIVHHILKNL